MSSNGPQLSFIDTIHAVPRLAEVLFFKSLRPLATTCTVLRALIHKRVTTVVVPCAKDAAVLCEEDWPNLAMIVITAAEEYQQRDTCVSLGTGWRMLVAMQLRQPSLSNYPITTSCSDRAVIIMPAWQSVQSLATKKIQTYNEKLQRFIRYYGPLNRRSCGTLHLATHFEGSKAVQSLDQGWWLDTLQLRYSKLDADAALHLGSSMQCLKSLSLVGQGCSMSTEALSCLTAHERGQLTNLALENTLDADSAVYLSKWQCPKLEALSLGSNLLGAAGFQSLALAHLPCLQTLSLESVPLDAAACAHLVKGNWPLLSSLHLTHTFVDEASYSILEVCISWQLRDLEVYRRLYSGMSCRLGWLRFSKYFWPKLTKVNVHWTC